MIKFHCFICIYNPIPLQRGRIYDDITQGAAMTVAENESDFNITRDTPYLTLTRELWGVCCDDLGANWPRYNGTALYMLSIGSADLS